MSTLIAITYKDQESGRGAFESLNRMQKMEILQLNRQMREWFPDIDVAQQPTCFKAFNDPPGTEMLQQQSSPWHSVPVMPTRVPWLP